MSTGPFARSPHCTTAGVRRRNRLFIVRIRRRRFASPSSPPYLLDGTSDAYAVIGPAYQRGLRIFLRSRAPLRLVRHRIRDRPSEAPEEILPYDAALLLRAAARSYVTSPVPRKRRTPRVLAPPQRLERAPRRGFDVLRRRLAGRFSPQRRRRVWHHLVLGRRRPRPRSAPRRRRLAAAAALERDDVVGVANQQVHAPATYRAEELPAVVARPALSRASQSSHHSSRPSARARQYAERGRLPPFFTPNHSASWP